MALESIRTALPELEQAVSRLRDAVAGAQSLKQVGWEPKPDEDRELLWAAEAMVSFWDHGVCANCGKPLSAHYGIEGRQCTTGAVIHDMESGDRIGATAGNSGWFTPRS